MKLVEVNSRRKYDVVNAKKIDILYKIHFMGSAASTRASSRRVPTTLPLDEWTVRLQRNGLEWRAATLVVDKEARCMRILQHGEEEFVMFGEIERWWVKDGDDGRTLTTLEGNNGFTLAIRGSAEAVDDIGAALSSKKG